MNPKFGHNYNTRYKRTPFPSQFKKYNVSNARTYGMDYKLRWDFIDDLVEPFKKMLEFTKVTAKLARSNQQSSYPCPYPVNHGYPLYFPPLNYIYWVVGYLGHVCKDCLVIDPLPIYFNRLGSVYNRHECTP
jgi:hypothetical protein